MIRCGYALFLLLTLLLSGCAGSSDGDVELSPTEQSELNQQLEELQKQT